MKRWLLALAVLATSCANLDAFLFNPTRVSAYTLPYDSDAPPAWHVAPDLVDAVTARDYASWSRANHGPVRPRRLPKSTHTSHQARR